VLHTSHQFRRREEEVEYQICDDDKQAISCQFEIKSAVTGMVLLTEQHASIQAGIHLIL
jgi:hypothetical protein